MIGLPSPRYILVHSHDATLDANNLDNRAHAFGPFEDWDALLAFDRDVADDTCYRFAVPLIGPEPRDLSVSMIGKALGFRPGSLTLPPRTKNPNPSIQTVVDRAMKEMKKAEKKKRKAEKKAQREAPEG